MGLSLCVTVGLLLHIWALCLTVDSQQQNVSVALPPVFLPPPVTYGNLSCEKFTTPGHCYATLHGHVVVVNYTRGNQVQASNYIDSFVNAVLTAPMPCLERVLPLLCFYAFPTCDPAYNISVYQPICKWDCQIIRDFYCETIWANFINYLKFGVINLGVLDPPQCDTIRFSNGGEAPMCISTQDGGPLSEVLVTDSCYQGLGRGYRGAVNTTESGLECQAWSEQYPNQHLLTAQQYPELNGSHNYCRNPGAKGNRPWCFTTNSTKRWEYCNIPKCKDGPYCERYTFSGSVCYSIGEIGIDYVYFNSSVGTLDQYNSSLLQLLTAAMTFKMAECQDMFKELLCMNSFPRCDLSTATPRPLQMCRGQCEVLYSTCKADIDSLKQFPLNIAPVEIPDCSRLPQPNGGNAPECFMLSKAQLSYYSKTTTNNDQTCYNPSTQGMDYNGFVNVTVGGHACQNWDSVSPHVHPISTVLRPYLQGNNWCRNPDGRGTRPWCYTADPTVRWEYCSIPVCQASIVSADSASSLLLVEIIVPSVAGGLLVFILGPCLCIILLSCYTCKLSRKKKELLHLSIVPGMVPPSSVEMLRVEVTKDGDGMNPLYCKNVGVRDIGLDGAVLPEINRDKVLYQGDLGQGHFGLVVKANAVGIVPGKEHCTVAVKILKEGASPQTKKEFFHEAALMHAFNHPNIVKLLGVCVEQEPLCMVFEFMELGDLNNFLRHNSSRWQESSVSRLGAPKYNIGLVTQVGMSLDITAGLAYLAENHYVHRDLATRNCLVGSDIRIKISDFGLSQDIYSTDYCRLSQSELLPIRWMPPEAILFARFTTQSDVWSLGVVLWEVFSYGIQPYFSMSNEQVIAHVREGNVMSCPDGCPQEIYDLMVDCWNMDPAQRPTAADVRMALGRWTPPSALVGGVECSGVSCGAGDYQNVSAVLAFGNGTTGVSSTDIEGPAMQSQGECVCAAQATTDI